MKLLIIVLFATALNVSAHIPDSVITVITNHIFQDGYLTIDLSEGDQAPYNYSDDVSMLNSDTVFKVKEPGTYKIFMVSPNNPSTQYQIDVVIEERPAIIKDNNGKAYMFDGKTLKYRGLKAKLKNCE